MQETIIILYDKLCIAVLVLLWLLHQKGLFDPIYDWCEDHFWADDQSVNDPRRHIAGIHHHHHHHHRHRHHTHNKHHKQEAKGHRHGTEDNRRNIPIDHKHKHSDRGTDYNYLLHHVHKEKHKHGRTRMSVITKHADGGDLFSKQKKKEKIMDYNMTRHKKM